mgnify:CR=1 FL=1
MQKSLELLEKDIIPKVYEEYSIFNLFKKKENK